jgi:hypothetical protein
MDNKGLVIAHKFVEQVIELQGPKLKIIDLRLSERRNRFHNNTLKIKTTGWK